MLGARTFAATLLDDGELGAQVLDQRDHRGTVRGKRSVAYVQAGFER